MHGLYLVTDRRLCGGNSLEEIIVKAVKGGVAYVQLREKDVSARLPLMSLCAIKYGKFIRL